MRGTSFWGIVLIALGLLFLGDKAGVISLNPVWFSAGVLWPLLFVLAGFGGVKKLFRGKIAWWELFLVVLGLSLSLKNAGMIEELNSVPTWDLIGALFLIFLGLSLTLPHRWRRSLFDVKVKRNDQDFTVDIGAKDLADGVKSWKAAKNRNALRRFVGDISIGKQAWSLKDMDIWNGIGDVRINLGTAHVEDGVYHISVGGWIGDVRILVPSTLPVVVQAEIRIGDIDVFGDKHSGTGHHVVHEDPEFKDSSLKVILDVDLKIGDVQLVRV